ncbi:MAG TPA: hypothetical protein VIX73_36730 [Kofleriaceae bacterium]
MRTIGLVLLVCLAACAKKPAPKPPTPPPSAEPAASPDQKEAPKPDVTNTPRTGDPCDGGKTPK